MFFIKKSKFQQVKQYFEDNAGKLSIIFFLGGFIFDNLTLNRIDSLGDNLILLSWLSGAFFFIFLNNWGDYRGFKSKFMYKLYYFAPFLIQLAFGGLFSGYVVFYTRSSTFFDSWPFLVILYFLFIANEKFRKQYEKFHVQITILFFAIFAFTIFYLPITMKKMNDFIFILSNIVALIIIYFIVKRFFIVIPNLKKFKFKIIRNILATVIVFNLLYFASLLPPVPLSVKEIGIYHYADRNSDGNYELAKETVPWFSWDNFYNIYHRQSGEKIYAYSSVFAPTSFETKIRYVWYWYNEDNKKWEEKYGYSQNLLGGRNNGFRSSAILPSDFVLEGKWKLYLVSNEGAVIDRIKFEVVNIDYDIPLEWEELNSEE